MEKTTPRFWRKLIVFGCAHRSHISGCHACMQFIAFNVQTLFVLCFNFFVFFVVVSSSRCVNFIRFPFHFQLNYFECKKSAKKENIHTHTIQWPPQNWRENTTKPNALESKRETKWWRKWTEKNVYRRRKNTKYLQQCEPNSSVIAVWRP